MPKLLYADGYDINDKIRLKIPTVGYVLDNEDSYYGAVTCIVATPYDMMVQLDDMGIDFSKIEEFELFAMMFGQLKQSDTSQIFDGLDLSKFQVAVNKQNGLLVLRDDENDITIDRFIHARIAVFLRTILSLEKNAKKPGNEEAKRYMLERARKKIQQAKRRHKEKTSTLEKHIVALVNTEMFKYNYETVRDLTIYQFYESLAQVTHKIKYDNTMIGYYAGTIKSEDLSKKDRSWIAIDDEY